MPERSSAAATAERAAATVADAIVSAEGPMTPNKRRIVEAAVGCFAEKGYDGTTTREIAKRAGVSEAAIFRHYPTKKDLMLGLFRPLAEQVFVPTGLDAFRTAMSEGLSPEEMLTRLLRNRVAFARQHAPLVRMVIQEIPFHPELQGMMQAQLPQLVGLVAQALDQWERAGDIATHDPARVVRWVGSLFIGYFLVSTQTGGAERWDDEAEIAAMARLIARGLRA